MRDAFEQIMPFVVVYHYPHEPVEITELEEEAEQAVATMRVERFIVRNFLGLSDE